MRVIYELVTKNELKMFAVQITAETLQEDLT
jgi:hypothetical protein